MRWPLDSVVAAVVACSLSACSKSTGEDPCVIAAELLACQLPADRQPSEGADRTSDGSASEESAAAWEAELIQTMIGREEAVFRPGRLTLEELFPPVRRSELLADAFRADVLSADVGRTFTDNMDANREPTAPVEEVPFDDPGADWRVFEIRVKVTEVFWGDAAAGTELILGLTFNAQTESKVVTEGFTSMGNLVVLTARGDFLVPYDPAITPVLWDGAVLSPVNGDRVPWPVLAEPASGAPVIRELDTLAELRQVGSR